MIKVSVLYPQSPGAKFDEKYYFSKHLPMVASKLGSAVKGLSVERGISGATPDMAPPYLMVAQFTFESTATFDFAFGPHMVEILGDLKNFTTIEPTIQISDIKYAK